MLGLCFVLKGGFACIGYTCDGCFDKRCLRAFGLRVVLCWLYFYSLMELVYLRRPACKIFGRTVHVGCIQLHGVKRSSHIPR